MTRMPIAEQLTRFRGGAWEAVKDGMTWRYECDTGEVVRCYSESVLDWDGYSDTKFVTVYISDRGMEVGRCGVIYPKIFG